jgi:hypothetical protein
MFPFLLIDVIFELALVLLVLMRNLPGRTRGALEVLGIPESESVIRQVEEPAPTARLLASCLAFYPLLNRKTTRGFPSEVAFSFHLVNYEMILIPAGPMLPNPPSVL